ncbi:MAG: signal peptidase I [Limnochordia bacterium]
MEHADSQERTTYKSEFGEYLSTLLGAVFLAVFVILFIARAFTVEGPSMLPTLHTGERLLIDKVTYRLRTPRRGEVIVFRYPADPEQYFIKRVIGLPGDTVVIRGGKVYVNDQCLEEDYVTSPILGEFGPYMVPEQSYFVLGDNRNNSEDSRSERVGYVSDELIIGRAIWRYWPITRVGHIADSPVLASP